MKAHGLRENAPAGRPGSESDREISLLVFEAAGCLMAVPSAEVVRLAVSARDLGGLNVAIRSLQLINLNVHFAAPADAGLWIEWRRGDRTGGLGVTRVLDVVPVALRTLRPMPARLRSARCTGPFLAIGLVEEDVFFLLDPAGLPW